MDPNAFAATIFGKLREGDPTEEYENARATIAAASKFLLDGFGEAHALGALNEMIFAVKHKDGRGAALERLANASTACGAPNLTPQVHAMTDHLRQLKPAQAHTEALAAMMAGAAFLGEQYGADYALKALRELETMTQRFTGLARWQPETRAN